MRDLLRDIVQRWERGEAVALSTVVHTIEVFVERVDRVSFVGLRDHA